MYSTMYVLSNLQHGWIGTLRTVFTIYSMHTYIIYTSSLNRLLNRSLVALDELPCPYYCCCEWWLWLQQTHTFTHTLSDKFLEGLACGCRELKGESAGAIVVAADGVQIVVGIALINAIALSLRFTFLGRELWEDGAVVSHSVELIPATIAVV